jgi:acetoin utilization protein AcuB
MLVRDRMTSNPVTIAPDVSFTNAFRIIREKKIGHLPVVDKKGRLVGIVAQRDLLHASPSSATTLTVFEINSLLGNLQVKEVMSSPPITVPDDTPIEEAARAMVDNEIGCLPVMRGDDLVGVITDTDIFKTFVEILSREEAELRVALLVPDVRGELARMAGVIAGLGGNLCSLASFQSEEPGYVYFTMRLKGVAEDVLVPALTEAGGKVLHVCPAG